MGNTQRYDAETVNVNNVNSEILGIDVKYIIGFLLCAVIFLTIIVFVLVGRLHKLEDKLETRLKEHKQEVISLLRIE